MVERSALFPCIYRREALALPLTFAGLFGLSLVSFGAPSGQKEKPAAARPILGAVAREILSG